MNKIRSVIKFLKNLWNLRQFNLVSIQMGKVGSSSILKSYPKSYQGHSWDDELPVKYFSSRNTSTLAGIIFGKLKWFIKFFIVNQRVNQAKKNGETLKLIVGVREPVSRNISGYFQSLNYRETKLAFESEFVKFFAFCPHAAPLYWIDNEIKSNFGFDLYDYDFDRDKGYTRFLANGFDVFVYKLEKLDRLEKEIGDFLEETDFRLKNDNVSSKSWHGEYYKNFVKNAKFSQAYLDFLYESKFAKHFYTDTEIQSFYKKWSK